MAPVPISMIDSAAANYELTTEYVIEAKHSLNRCLQREGALIDRLSVAVDSVAAAHQQERERFDHTLRVRTDELNEARNKVHKLRPFATVGKVAIYGGIAVGGIVLFNELKP